MEQAEGAPEVAEAPEAPEPAASERTVPVREVQKERRERQKLEKQLAELQATQEQAAQAELSEVERLKNQLAETQQQAEAAEKARVRATQESLLRTAAQGAGFSDPQDALTFTDFSSLEGLEGESLTEAVSDEITRLASEKPYLVKQVEEEAASKPRSLGSAVNPDNAGDLAEGPDAIGKFVHSALFGKK